MPRVMTEHLARVLDGLSESERRALLRVAADSDAVTPMARVLRAVATELRVRQLAEDELILELERDRAADMDELHAGWPSPGPDPALRLTVDPDTGEFRPDSDPGEGVSP